MRLTPAETLDDVYETLSPQPLLDPEPYEAFYRPDINKVRGSDKVEFMVRGLDHAHQGAFYRTFLMGHSGVGKSTEMTRLSHLVKDKYNVIRFSAQTDLDADGFKPFDVLLAMMIKLAEETIKPVMENGTGTELSPRLLEKILL